MIGIILGLLALVILAFKGWSIIWAAPIAALIVAIFGGQNLLEAYTVTYMTGMVGFFQSWFPAFMLSAIFGKLMEHTGMAKSIAVKLSQLIGSKRAILAVVLACAILTYGGISLFVVVFAIYPLAVSLFREANISRKLIPGTIALGAFTFTMTAMPGTPQIQNLIPMEFFHTTPTSAPIIGVVSSIIMLVGGLYYLGWKDKKLRAKGIVFDEPEKSANAAASGEEKLPNVWISILPLLTVISTLNILDWNIIVALLAGNVLILLFNLKSFKHFIKYINEGANGSMIAIINTSAAVGFGAVVRSVPAFTSLTEMLTDIPGNPLISMVAAVNLLAGATGSASGGLGIALAALGEKYYELAIYTGTSPAAFHRLAAMASGGLDVLPHNGAVLTLLAITGMTHKDSYSDIAWVAIIIPLIASVVGILMAIVGIY